MEDQDSKPDQAEEKTGVAPKKSIKKWGIMGVLVLFLGGGAYGAWNFFLAGKFSQKSDQAIAKTRKTSPQMNTSPAITHEMDPFIVNLLDQQGKRYLKAKLELEVEDNDIKEELIQRTAQLRDTILLLLTSKSFEDISSPEGKIQLRGELIVRINQVLQRGAIRTLYFTEFVVQ